MVEGEDLRALMRRWPHGVAVLTVAYDGERMGFTVSSLVSLSLEPPLVGVAIGKHAAGHELVRHAGAFALSLLAADQEELARRFAAGRPPLLHWEGVALRDGTVAPLLEGALGWIEARTRAEHDVGDHTLFVAEVVAAEPGAAGRPLVYHDREYSAL